MVVVHTQRVDAAAQSKLYRRGHMHLNTTSNSASLETLRDSRNRMKLYDSLLLGDNEVRILILHPGRSRHRRLVADLLVETLPTKGLLYLQKNERRKHWQCLNGPDYCFSDDGQFFRMDTRCFYSRTNCYEALSYVWGSSETLCTIIVNGLRIRIGQNLYKALRQLRSRHRRKLLWIDALCINQRDDLEKSLQVSNMANIYSKAWQVIIWLGEDSPQEDGRLALAFWAWLGSRSNIELSGTFPLDLAIKEARGNLEVSQKQIVWPNPNRQDRFALSINDRKALSESHISQFFQRCWFARRWVSAPQSTRLIHSCAVQLIQNTDG